MLSAIFVQPLFSEISFDDFITSENSASKQREFFDSCRSTLGLENVSFLETNPFQVSYLKDLISKFDQCLIDKGGGGELVFKEVFLSELHSFRDISSLVGFVPKLSSKINQLHHPIDPIDFLIADVHKELARLRDVSLPLELIPDKLRKLLCLLGDEKLSDQSLLYQRSGLNPKDFDDGLERLKFLLRSL